MKTTLGYAVAATEIIEDLFLLTFRQLRDRIHKRRAETQLIFAFGK